MATTAPTADSADAAPPPESSLVEAAAAAASSVPKADLSFRPIVEKATNDLALQTESDDDDDEDNVSVESELEDNSLCLALYYPPASEKSNSAATITPSSPMWWPAIQYSSMDAFLRAKKVELDEQLATHRRNKSLTKRKANHVENLMLRHFAAESVGCTRFQTLYYLSRPLWEYRTSDPLSDTNRNKPVQVQKYSAGMAVDIARLWNQPQYFPSKQIYLDFHRASEKANLMLLENDDVPKESGFMADAIQAWEEWEQENPQLQRQQQNLLPEAQAAAAGHPPVDDHMEDEPEEEDEELHHFQHAHGSPMAQSIAAVSYTDASLESVKTNHTHTPSRSSRGERRPSSAGNATTHTPTAESTTAPELPPKLSPISRPKAPFEEIWHKFQLEGWDTYQDTDSQEMIYQAPNGYSFSSQAEFHQFLQDEYGWEPPPPPGQRRSTKRQRAMADQCQEWTSAEKRPRRSEGGKTSSNKAGDYWNYVRTLGWTYTTRPRGMPGFDTWVYYRPGFNNKNRGSLGQDHFLTEDEILDYCLENDIHPPPSPGASTSEEENNGASNPEYGIDGEGSSEREEHEEEEEEDDDEEEEETSPSSPDGDDSGYETPTGQSTSPQDPSKPLDRDLDDEELGDQDEDDQYVWGILWSRLQRYGWEMKVAPNRLDNWWYCKPVRAMRNLDDDAENQDSGPRAMQKGIDYFTSQEEVIAYCKERDNVRKKQKAKSGRTSVEPHFKRDTSGYQAARTIKSGNQENSDSKKAAKKSKKRGGDTMETTARKMAKKQRGPKSFEDKLKDKGLTVEATSNQAPWALNAPLFEHRVIVGSSFGVSYHSTYYYLPGESPRDYTERFESTTDIVQYLAKDGKLKFDAVGATPIDQEFFRYLRYAFVCGKPSEWSLIRRITKTEAFSLLQEAGYSSSADGGWIPPEPLIGSGLLASSFNSFDSLCDALRCMDDLETTGGGSRRRKPGKLSLTQTMALKLAIADGFAADAIEESIVLTESEHTEQSTTTVDRPAPSRDERATAAAAQKSKGKKKSQDLNKAKNEEELSPDKIKVKFKGKEDGDENPAPWVASPFFVPAGGWHKCYETMGWKYSNNRYFLPGEIPMPAAKEFTKTSDLQEYICQHGDYDKFLNKIPEQDRPIVRRHFNYAHVPETEHSWKKIRMLTTKEVVLFLNLLGFQQGADGSWTIPKGLPILDENERFASLAALGQALVRVPDLEDRSKGESTKRRARKRDRILNEHQMMALRLRLAEGLEDDIGSTTVVSEKPKSSNSFCSPEASTKNADDENNPTAASKYKASRAVYDVCSHKLAWDYLQALGCTYRTKKYRLPGSSTFRSETLNELIEYVLEKSVAVLDWNHCSLTQTQLKEFEFYLRCFNAKLNNDSPTGDATRLLHEGGSITSLFNKLGITRMEDGQYQIPGDSHMYNTADLANKIRATRDLLDLIPSTGATPRRIRPKLMDTEILAVRLWSISIDIPLPNFPDASFLQNVENCKDVNSMKSLEGAVPEVVVEQMPRASKVTDVEEVAPEVEESVNEGGPTVATEEDSVTAKLATNECGSRKADGNELEVGPRHSVKENLDDEDYEGAADTPNSAKENLENQGDKGDGGAADISGGIQDEPTGLLPTLEERGQRDEKSGSTSNDTQRSTEHPMGDADLSNDLVGGNLADKKKDDFDLEETSEGPELSSAGGVTAPLNKEDEEEYAQETEARTIGHGPNSTDGGVWNADLDDVIDDSISKKTQCHETRNDDIDDSYDEITQEDEWFKESRNNVSSRLNDQATSAKDMLFSPIGQSFIATKTDHHCDSNSLDFSIDEQALGTTPPFGLSTQPDEDSPGRAFASQFDNETESEGQPDSLSFFSLFSKPSGRRPKGTYGSRKQPSSTSHTDSDSPSSNHVASSSNGSATNTSFARNMIESPTSKGM